MVGWYELSGKRLKVEIYGNNNVIFRGIRRSIFRGIRRSMLRW